jgi:branched-chain amino acid transport system substrate-binding protein
MTKPSGFDRRSLLKTAALGSIATVSMPAVLRAQAPSIKIGILQPVTGALAQDGEYGRLGAEIALKELNAAGGIKSMGGAKLEMVFGDARSNPEGGTQEVERMQGEGVSAIVGGFASPIVLAASQAASRYDIPYLVDVGVSDQIVKRGLKNTFRFGPGFGSVTAAALDNLVKLNDAAGKPAKTVMIVHEDGLFGSGMAKLLQAELPKRGFEILETVAHPTPSRDMANVALRIRALNPDLVIPSSYYSEFVLLARTMQQQRIKPKGIYAVLNGAASNFRFVKEFPTAAENVMDCNHWADMRKPRTALVRGEVERAGKEWLYNTPLNYSSVILLADAIERAASADRLKIIEALNSSTFADHIMPYGPTKFVDGQNTGAQAVNTQVQNGDIKIIFPNEFANAKAIFPVT